MPETESAQIYLVTPPDIDPDSFGDVLSALLDVGPVACLRLELAARDEARIGRAADTLREIAHARDVPLVIASHLALVERHGLDGVHLPDLARSVRKARKALGPDRIIGAFCGASRDIGMSAGEAGADYVAFGPVQASALGDGTLAPHDLFAWWSEMIEVPVVAEGVDADTAATLASVADFIVPDQSLWTADDPAAELRRIASALA